MNNPSVLVCTVAWGEKPSWEYVNSIFALQTPGVKMFKRIMGKQGVDDGHNRVIEWFLQGDYEWMLHLDLDAAVHPNTLLRLLSWNVPFVSALAFQRKPPFVPVIYTERDEGTDYFKRPVDKIRAWIREHPELAQTVRPTVLEPRPDDALIEVQRGGAHCCLTHRSVFEAIKSPWFVRTGPNAVEGRGSDFYFHQKVREAGFKAYVDLSVVAGHLSGDLCIGALDFVVWDAVAQWNESGRPTGIRVELSETKE